MNYRSVLKQLDEMLNQSRLSESCTYTENTDHDIFKFAKIPRHSIVCKGYRKKKKALLEQGEAKRSKISKEGIRKSNKSAKGKCKSRSMELRNSNRKKRIIVTYKGGDRYL